MTEGCSTSIIVETPFAVIRQVSHRRTALIVCVLGTVGCSRPAPPKPTEAQQARTVNAVFESAEKYTVRTLDTLELFQFLEEHPEYHNDSASIIKFYKRRGGQYAWFVNDSLSSVAGTFMNLVTANDSMLGNAFGHDALHQLVERISDPLDTIPLTETFIRHVELSLTAQFFRFGDRKYSGLIQRDLRELEWFIPRRKKDLDQLIDSLVAGRMDLSPIEPLHPQYALLKAQLSGLHRLQWMDGLPRLDLGERRKLEPGDRDSLLLPLRTRLALLGDLAWSDLAPGVPPFALDSALEQAVRRFQLRHGLLPDGVVGKGFIEQINIPIAQRIRTLLVNMERLRWVPERPSPNMLLVNIPEFRLHVVEADTEVWAMDVVVGAQATSTLIFSDSLSRIVFSPTWSVPASIVRNEILPAMRMDPGYLGSKNMTITGGSATLPRIVQQPGPSNALGLVKFLFPNTFSIYFHDTPSKGAFAREKRALSHGCIRLSDPKRLAQYLLRNDTTWTSEKIDEAMHRGTELGVAIRPKLPVVIGYFTAWVDGLGYLHFRDDIYGHDAKLAGELFEEVVMDTTSPREVLP